MVMSDRFCKWFPVVPRGADRFIASDDDGVARMVEVRFLNLQPHFCSHVDDDKFNLSETPIKL
ncbi:hypothetical protein HanPI659440_Chr15g0609151 [Helianthus annuus]|nr:hypothetical protein HanPI659440_Chr15g0609151 [Helianthus annuus]